MYLDCEEPRDEEPVFMDCEHNPLCWFGNRLLSVHKILHKLRMFRRNGHGQQFINPPPYELILGIA